MKGRQEMTTTWKWTGSGDSLSDASDRDAGGMLKEAALQKTMDLYWSKVCGTLYNLVGDWDEAEDLALEVFCRLHKQPPAEMSKVASWLYRVATNIGLNAIRARKRRTKYEEAAGALRVQRTTPVTPDLEVERREDRRRVQTVLAEMRPRYAQLLILRYLGLSYKELAGVLDVATGSVGTLLARAEKEFEERYRAQERAQTGGSRWDT
jgi:RNA polymerase sigma-70 factor (ECF subfamily)